MKLSSAVALLSAALPASAAIAQTQPATAIAGTRLDVVATGEVTRVPDIVRINAGVSTRATTASEAIRANSTQIDSIRAALRRAGVEARDVQTSSVDLNQDWRHLPNREPELIGYRATHRLSVRFRDAANAGRILDALVSAGANEINGPSFEIERPAEALDEARARALAAARARGELYARGLGMRIRRIVSVSEQGASQIMPGFVARASVAQDANTNIVLGEQSMGVTLTVIFELE